MLRATVDKQAIQSHKHFPTEYTDDRIIIVESPSRKTAPKPIKAIPDVRKSHQYLIPKTHQLDPAQQVGLLE